MESSNDWVRVQSRSTGAYYWSNVATGQSAWELDSQKIEKVERNQFHKKIPSGGALIIPVENNSDSLLLTEMTGLNMSQLDEHVVNIAVNNPEDSSNLVERARSDMIHYLETLTKIDHNLGDILSTMPSALKRTIESDQFRMRANARFEDLLFLDSKNYLTADEFAPQALALVSDQQWASHLEPSEISRGILSCFGSPLPKLTFEKNESLKNVDRQENDVTEAANNESKNTKNESNETSLSLTPEQENTVAPLTPDIVLKKVAFQRILAASTIVTFLESNDGGDFSFNRKKLMTSLSQYLKQVNMNETSTRLKAERVASERAKKLTSAPRSDALKGQNGASIFVGFVRPHDEVHIEAHIPSPSPSPGSNGSDKPNSTSTSASEAGYHSGSNTSTQMSNLFKLPNSRVRFEVFVKRSNNVGTMRLRYGIIPLSAVPYQDFVPSFGELEFADGISEVYITLDLIRPTYEQLSAKTSLSPTSDSLPIKIVKELEIQLRSPSFYDTPVISGMSSPTVSTSSSELVALRCASCRISLIYSMPVVGSMLKQGNNTYGVSHVSKGVTNKPNIQSSYVNVDVNKNDISSYLLPYKNSTLLAEVKSDSANYSLQEQMSKLRVLLGKPIVQGLDWNDQAKNSLSSNNGNRRKQLNKSSSLPLDDQSNSRTRRSSEKKETHQNSHLGTKPKSGNLIRPQPRSVTSSTRKFDDKKMGNIENNQEEGGEEYVFNENEDEDTGEKSNDKDSMIQRVSSDDERQRDFSGWKYSDRKSNKMSVDRPPSSQSSSSSTMVNSKSDTSITGNISRIWNRVSSPTQRGGLEHQHEELKEEVVSDISSDDGKNQDDERGEEDIQTLQEEAEKVKQRLALIAKELSIAGITVEEDDGIDHNSSFRSLRSSVELPYSQKKKNIPDKLAQLRARSTSQDSRNNRPRVSKTNSRNSSNENSRERIARRKPSPMKDRGSGDGLVPEDNKKPSLLQRMFRDSRERSVGEDVVEQSNEIQKQLQPVSETEDYDYNKIDSQMEQFVLHVFRPIIECSTQLSSIKCTPHHFFKLCGHNSKQALSRGSYLPGLTIQDLKNLCKKLKVDYLSSSLAGLRKAFKMVDQGEFKELSETVNIFSSQSELPANARHKLLSPRRLAPSPTFNTSSNKTSSNTGGTKGNVLGYFIWAVAWSAHFENKKVRSPRYAQLQSNQRMSVGRVRARNNWLKVVRTVTTARYWSNLANVSWQSNNSDINEEASLPLSPVTSTNNSSRELETKKPTPSLPPSPEMVEARSKHKLMKNDIKLKEEKNKQNKLSETTKPVASTKINSTNIIKTSKTVEKVKQSMMVELDDEGRDSLEKVPATGKSLEATMKEWRKRADHREELFNEASKLLGQKPTKRLSTVSNGPPTSRKTSIPDGSTRRGSSLTRQNSASTARTNSLSRSNSLKKEKKTKEVKEKKVKEAKKMLSSEDEEDETY